MASETGRDEGQRKVTRHHTIDPRIQVSYTPLFSRRRLQPDYISTIRYPRFYEKGSPHKCFNGNTLWHASILSNVFNARFKTERADNFLKLPSI